jgi:hypothetical protein
MMSKSKLREEYEARFGVVVGYFRLYDDKGNIIYCETSDKHWYKHEYDSEGNEIYYENSGGLWDKREYDADGAMIYYENSWSGVALDDRPCSDKVFIEEQTGKKYKMVEVKGEE